VAIVIDFSGKEPPKKTPVPPTDQPLTTEAPSACKHTRALVSESERTVTCKDCGAAVDPIAYIMLLYHQYETRVDRRLAEIREYEQREQQRRERTVARERQPRRRRIERRAETAERAAYNEYQAQVLAARATRQRQLVERLDAEIAALPPDAGAEGATGSEALPSNSVIVALQK